MVRELILIDIIIIFFDRIKFLIIFVETRLSFSKPTMVIFFAGLNDSQLLAFANAIIRIGKSVATQRLPAVP